MVNRPKPQRRSIRLPDYDYSSEGAYFGTICTKNRECLFGEIRNGEMILNEAGKMVQTVWRDLPKRFPFIELDQFVVMPNHFHGILILNDRVDRRGESRIRPVMGGGGSKQGEHKVRPYGTLDKTVGRIVQAFKSLVTHEYLNRIKTHGWPQFSGRLWQRNYYEHIIRNEKSLNKIRQYIMVNPLNWPLDIENPATLSHPDARRVEEKFRRQLT